MSTAEHIAPMYTSEKASPEESDNDKKNAGSSEKDLGLDSETSVVESEPEGEVSRGRSLLNKYKIFLHLAIWLVMTGYVSLIVARISPKKLKISLFSQGLKRLPTFSLHSVVIIICDV